MTTPHRFETHRALMKSNFPELTRIRSDQQIGRPQPPLEKPVPAGARRISLPPVDPAVIAEPEIYACLKRRRSRRSWKPAPIELAELSFLLWATQGVQRVFGGGYSTFRTVPSGGARHPFETYLALNQVTGLAAGIYRYLPLSHTMVVEREASDLAQPITDACLGQSFVGEAPVVFFWSCLPVRGEWRYNVASHKIMLIDAGHLCQNLYLACEAIGAGTCAIAAYDQQLVDRLVGVDGIDEFVVYLAPVGKVRG